MIKKPASLGKRIAGTCKPGCNGDARAVKREAAVIELLKKAMELSRGIGWKYKDGYVFACALAQVSKSLTNFGAKGGCEWFITLRFAEPNRPPTLINVVFEKGSLGKATP